MVQSSSKILVSEEKASTSSCFILIHAALRADNTTELRTFEATDGYDSGRCIYHKVKRVRTLICLTYSHSTLWTTHQKDLRV